MTETIKISTQRIIQSLILFLLVGILLPSCTKSNPPKGVWILDCGMVENNYGDYRLLYFMNVDLENPTISYESDYGEIMTYGTWDFSNMNKLHSGYIDSVKQISENVYTLHYIDTAWEMDYTDTLRYFPDKEAFTFSFGDDSFFVKKEAFEKALAQNEQENGIATVDNKATDVATNKTNSKKENSSLVTWIVIIAVILLILCIGIKISGELDGWSFAVPISAVLAVLVCIVGYNIVILDKIPGQLQSSPSDGIAPLLWTFGSMIIIAVSYFWSIRLIQSGLAEDDNYVSIGCGKWVMILLMINVFAGMATEFQPFRDISSDFIGSITFKHHFMEGILACTLTLALILMIIQIIQFFVKLNPIVATIATILFPLYVAGGVAMCVSCIPMLIVTLIVFGLFKLSFHGTVNTLNKASQEADAGATSDTPDEVEFYENGSIAKTTARHEGADIYRTSDGRKFRKEGDTLTRCD